ncbi:bifunctional DNA-formamidopyrimidine glycosylase/DNA-(apurinic or apyrimidinic site) lyase [Aliikangiella marina]|uniref:Formamidopyrimidine-DNA glycosylase n=1 Tax=Aliikangiella marina TaxID=1712262 RepID=A0A545TBP1_9GAMM|nr:bifunctional DNA-formamidopyrimidine glycosylase/DNA-(apurinic or apyrimidinic site) lyase [Aliikangiella marina]TQV74642.1 bifunctional DNA-formamidopyrimidine glycosylase/DNA-(apurinic or apyrimidinic site) lyase [Aliikangiella marina]
MPELPEVETSGRGIAPHCINQQISQLIIREKKLRWPVESSMARKVNGQTIHNISRRGKYLLLEIDIGYLMIHLGMSGSLRVVDDNRPVEKHDHIDICLANQKIIRYNDPRRFGSFILNKQGLTHPLLAKLGVEPLTDDFDANYLFSICKSRKVAIKPLIMNSHVVVGVGNIYAQESLFRAGIHPKRPANKVSKARIERLVEEIKLVLAEAIEAGGSSLKDFTAADGKPGYFQHNFLVYGREGEPCPSCQKPLKQKQIGQRTTVYCGTCQR